MSERIFQSTYLYTPGLGDPRYDGAEFVKKTFNSLVDDIAHRAINMLQKPIWDTFEVSTTADIIDDRTLTGEAKHYTITTMRASVLAVTEGELA